MKHRKLFINLVLLLAALLAQFAVATATRPRNAKQTKFSVRVENISSAEGQIASDGTKWPFALSPGMFVLHHKKSPLFTEGRPAINGLEAQAEDGNPAGLLSSLEMSHHTPLSMEFSIHLSARWVLGRLVQAAHTNSASLPFPE